MNARHRPADAVVHDLGQRSLYLALAAVTRMETIWPADDVARMRADIRRQAKLQRTLAD